MTRQKVKLAYITNNVARKATFRKRMKGFMKKMIELSVLCGIQMCAIVYSEFNTEPEVWPNPSGARQTITRFKQLSKMDRCKRMLNRESFFRQRILRAKEKLKKHKEENIEKEIMIAQKLVGEGLHNLSFVELNELWWLVEKIVDEIEEYKILFPKKP